ncbi:MAG TPA: GNAT family N-acetyltransferase [Firmicutes bacterium]|nr:GNAT family N-acetyltransferase [Bacillota bacterium]
MHREISEAADRSPQLIEQLLKVWERSVRATHLFLSADEVAAIKPYVPQALRAVPHLIVARRADGTPMGFMGIDGQKLEMLFLAPEARGKGLGGALVRYGMERFDIREVTVNEQNPQARGFYERMGFRVCQRSAQDEQGRPYPILNMRLGE